MGEKGEAVGIVIEDRIPGKDTGEDGGEYAYGHAVIPAKTIALPFGERKVNSEQHHQQRATAGVSWSTVMIRPALVTTKFGGRPALVAAMGLR